MINKIPDISIIITNHNYGKYIERCIRSCINQTNVNHEVIVVDDNSVDNSRTKIDLFEKEIVKIFLDENVGVSEASNIALNKAKGRFFVRVDSDDYISPDMCYFQQYYLKSNRDLFGVAVDYILVDEYEQKQTRINAADLPISCGVMYRKDQFLITGGYNPFYRYKEHEEFLKRLNDLYYHIEYLKIPFYRYRRHGENKTLTKEYNNTII